MSNNGWSNQTSRRLVVVEGTNFSGLFFYSPAPGAGNLVGSWTAQSGTDPYGNQYTAGIQTYYPDGRTGFSAGFPSSLSGQGLTVAADSTQPFAASISWGTDFDNSLTPFMQAFNDGATVVSDFVMNTAQAGWISHNIAAFAPSSTIAESWHLAALGAGFTTSVADQPPRYRYEPVGAGGQVRLDGTVYTSAATAAGALAFTLPVGYRPAASPTAYRKRFVGTTNASGYTTLGGSLWTISPTGQVTLTPACSGAGQQACLDGIVFPVD